jgi:signal transduction histidine kinase/ActR/RegA family two-component response regulator
MFFFIRTRSSAGRVGAYALTLPAVGLGLWAALLIARTDARPLATTPLALAVALSAGYGGLGPGLLALAQASLGVDFFLIERGTLFQAATPAQMAALIVFVAGWTLFCVLAAGAVRRADRIRQAQAAAEAASAHAERMTQLTSALAQARTPRAAIEAAVQESVYALRADAAALLLVSADRRTAEIARAVGYPSGQAPSAVTLSEKGPVSDAVGRGVAVVIESRAVRAKEYPASTQPAIHAFETAVIAPLLIGSRVVAVIQLEFEARREISQRDHEYLRALAHGGAQALDRTWELELAERGRSEAEHLRAQADRELGERKTVEHALRASETRYRALAARTSRLHALSAALSGAVTMEAVGCAVTTHGRVVVGATAGEVLLLVDEGTWFETLHAEADGRRDRDRARVPVEDGLCATAAVRTGRPVFIPSLEDWQERFWRSASVAADGGYQSSATMPLLVEGVPIGVLTFHFTVPVNFDDEYQALLVSVAEHCAQALDRARLYESTQRARSDAERANRVKDEFVSIVSHELRTPLNAILGWTTMLLSGALAPDKSARALRSIHDNASRQARLIEELLDFSRVTSGRASLQMEQVDVRELLRGVVESMVPSAVARAVELDLPVVPPVYVRGDIRRLEQVFFNLIDNALKFTPDGGRVAIDVRIVDGQIQIQVQDNGAGIEPEFLPHVFERFRQAGNATSRTHGGLGLGMSIAKQLVEAHDGRISATSEGKGRGSTFTVQLPIVTPVAAEKGVAAVFALGAAAEKDERRLDGVRVLVVDDEADARDIMATALEASGASVELAASARAAFEILERTPVDVLLSDIAMPEEDGFALIQKVRASVARRVATIPAAAVTAFTGADDRAHALAAGFHLHLAKPFEPTELIRTVDKLAHEVSV